VAMTSSSQNLATDRARELFKHSARKSYSLDFRKFGKFCIWGFLWVTSQWKHVFSFLSKFT